MTELLSKLDLLEFITSFSSLFAREKPIYLEGDTGVHFRYINELQKFEFSPPPKLQNLDIELVHLSKFGVLKLDEIFEFIKIVRYFKYLRVQKFENQLLEWMQNITIPEQIAALSDCFEAEPSIKSGVNPQLDSIKEALKANKANISKSLQYLISSPKLSPYLVDRQVHYLNSQESILLRGGFNHVIKAQVIGRSSGGFFYVIPESIVNLKKKESELLSTQEELIYSFCKDASGTLNKHLLFLKFINREFDRFDHYQARVLFAKSNDFEFMLPKKDDKIILCGFCHPAIEKPKSLNLDFSKRILMVTGVNAGGKTMLLKSILSSVYLAKHLIPFKIDASKSHIGHFKEIEAIIEDPQNVKNDISTFAGRMVSFSKILAKRGVLLGVDEIELGTDSDEAASLFKVILEHLLLKECKIVITTHHKRLASLMAGHHEVELLAALFDEERQVPTFNFLSGTIGKSYAFETALRYGIPRNIIKEAITVYGEDKERLNELIERSSSLEFELNRKKRELEEELTKAKNIRESLEDEKERVQSELKKFKFELEMRYLEAIDEAKKAAKLNEPKEIHRIINRAHTIAHANSENKQPQEYDFKIGDAVKSDKTKGIITALSKSDATVETLDGFKIRVPKSSLRPSGTPPKQPVRATKVSVENPKYAAVSLDLHGLRAEEALERLDKFISDALIAGFDEVLIFHGIGTGKLAFAVRGFLESHPKIKEFKDAPPQMGGYGAKLVKL